MENRYTAFLFVTAFATGVIAQPNFPSGSLSYAPGDAFILHQSTYFDPPATGIANATWNYADLSSSGSVTDQFVTPPGSGPAGSTVAEVAGSGAYAFYKATPTSFEQLGLSSPQATLDCSDPIKVFPYPLTFGTTMNDTYVCTGTSTGLAFTRTGTYDIVGTSWGTLSLPYGTFNNVLMVSIEQYHVDTFLSDPDFPYGYSATIQLFLRPGVKAPLLANYMLYSIPGQVFMYSRYVDESSVGVEEAQRNVIGIDIMPNPASGSVGVEYGVAAGSAMNLEILDITGKIVLQQDRKTMVTGIQREVLDISSVAAGVYTLRITDAKGASGTKRLIVR